jgi:hypothetical protein
VVAQQQVVGEVGDGWPLAVWVALDGDEQLVLTGGEAGVARLGLALVDEPAQAGTDR